MIVKKIMIIEDEALVAEDIKAHLEEWGHHVSTIIGSGENALTLLEGSRPDLVLMDIVLSGKIDGIDVAEVINEKYHIPVIYLTAYTDREKVERAQATQPYGYLVKPFDDRELRTTIDMALYKAEIDKRLHESRRWAHAVLHSISDGVITTNSQGNIKFFNPQALSMLKLDSEQFVNKPLSDLIQFQDKNKQSEFESCIVSNLQLGKVYTFHAEDYITKSNDDLLPIEATANPIEYDNARSSGLVFTFHDISVRKNAQQQLEQYNEDLERKVNERTAALQQSNIELRDAKEQAEASNLAKSRFLANISHELKTPLNPAIGYAQLLMSDESLGSEQKNFVNEIYSSCSDLVNLINDLLRLASSDTGELSLRKDEIDVISMLREIYEGQRETATSKNIDFLLNVPENVPVLLGDKSTIKHVINKLLDNAFKFTSQGSVSLNLSTKNIRNDQIKLLLDVTDTGTGIEPELHEHIFDRFNQGDNSPTRQYNGLGLGLALCKQLVEHMGGEIGLESEPGKGSRFWVSLKLVQAES